MLCELHVTGKRVGGGREKLVESRNSDGGSGDQQPEEYNDAYTEPGEYGQTVQPFSNRFHVSSHA